MNIQCGPVRLDLEPRGFDFGEVIEHDVIRDGAAIGRTWTPDGVNWFLTLNAHGPLRWIGDSARDVTVEAAEFLAGQETP